MHMATNDKEGFLEKSKEFFTQTPEDRKYEEAGGDDRIPLHERTDDPKADAKRFAAAQGERDPYPEYEMDGDGERPASST